MEHILLEISEGINKMSFSKNLFKDLWKKVVFDIIRLKGEDKMNSYHIFNELSEKISIRINQCGMIKHGADWIESKIHRDYDIWIIQTGKVTVAGTDGTFTANKGDVVFFVPSKIYTAYATDGDCSFIYIHFSFSIEENFNVLQSFCLSGIIPNRFVQKGVQMINEIFPCYQNKEICTSLNLKACLMLLISDILRASSKGQLVLFSQIPLQAVRSLTVIHKVLEFIHCNIQSDIKIADLAAIANMSEKYFISYFKKAVGVTPGQYIYQYKMNQARDYLLQRQLSIKEIANLLGYPDQYTFSKVFKRFYNVPPSKFI